MMPGTVSSALAVERGALRSRLLAVLHGDATELSRTVRLSDVLPVTTMPFELVGFIGGCRCGCRLCQRQRAQPRQGQASQHDWTKGRTTG